MVGVGIKNRLGKEEGLEYELEGWKEKRGLFEQHSSNKTSSDPTARNNLWNSLLSFK